VLSFHVVGLKDRAREHILPVRRDALDLDEPQVERLRIVDEAEAPLRRDELGDLREMMPVMFVLNTYLIGAMLSAATWAASGFI